MPKPANLTPSPTPPPTSKPDDLLYKLICSTMFQRSTYIPIHVHTVDSNCPMVMEALIDTGATGQFIDIEYVRSNELWTYCLPHSLAVYNVDGTPNEAGCITEAVDLVVHYKDHMDRPPFMSRVLAKVQSFWDTLGLQNTTLT